MEAAFQSQLQPPQSATPQSHETGAAAEQNFHNGNHTALSVIGTLLGAALALRFWMLHKFFEVNGDAEIYGGIAKNLLLHGRYALTGAGNEIYPTLIRLPGYPYFLALCFRCFGMENYWAVAVVQIVLEIAGCLLLADTARKIAPARYARRAGWATLALACLCPFTASYTALPLTETPTLFCIALALWTAERFGHHPEWKTALGFTASITFAALLRPDGALVGVALAAAMLSTTKALKPQKLAKMAAISLLLAILPFALWGARNRLVFHVFQPLAPRYATEPGESINPGWIRWIQSWCLDFNCTSQVYWAVPGEALKLSALPPMAFDSSAQREETTRLAEEYNSGTRQLTPQIDERFAQLAEEREQSHPWRTRLWLPVGRMISMWLRPRIENLPIDPDWRNYPRHHSETVFSWFYAGLNAVLLLLALGGLLLKPRLWWAMLLYAALRSLLLLTVEAPEARYTLECFPMIFVLAGVFLAYLCEHRSACGS